jgi:Winged helix-turn helix
MARIVEHLPVAELEARYRAARDATEARHFQAIWLLAQGRTFLEVAEVLAFVPRWVEELAASLLTEAVLSALAERVQAPPEEGGVWSGPKVAAWIARHLGVQRVHPQRGWEALQRIGWSIQAPRPRHVRAATPAERADFKKGSRRPLHRPRRRIPTGRSRSGRRTSTASA